MPSCPPSRPPTFHPPPCFGSPRIRGVSVASPAFPDWQRLDTSPSPSHAPTCCLGTLLPPAGSLFPFTPLLLIVSLFPDLALDLSLNLFVQSPPSCSLSFHECPASPPMSSTALTSVCFSPSHLSAPSLRFLLSLCLWLLFSLSVPLFPSPYFLSITISEPLSLVNKELPVPRALLT